MSVHASGTAGANRLQAVVLDWSGTAVDYGSRAPVAVFVELFRRWNVPISIAQARVPMGMEKRDHIRAIAADPDVATRWQATHGRSWNEDDIAAMYADSLPLQTALVTDFATPIPGTPEVVAACRARGLRIGSTTGYSRVVMDRLAPAAAVLGYAPDTIVCPEDVGVGRPAPFMIWRALMRLHVYPATAAVVVGDTLLDIAAGRNAGAWTVGLHTSGNELGLHPDEIAALDPSDLASRTGVISDRMREAGAHYVIPSLAEIMPVLDAIECRLVGGETP